MAGFPNLRKSDRCSALTLLQSTLLHPYSTLLYSSATLYSTPTAPFSTPPLLRSTLLHRYCTLLYSAPTLLHRCCTLLNSTSAPLYSLRRRTRRCLRARRATLHAPALHLPPLRLLTRRSRPPPDIDTAASALGRGHTARTRSRKNASRRGCGAQHHRQTPSGALRDPRPRRAPSRFARAQLGPRASCIFEHGPLEHTAHAHFAKWWRQTGNRRRLCSLESGQSTAAVV